MADPTAPSRIPTILHVDMDAFFASVEVLDDPSLVGLPVIVGGTGNRGVVAACTYEARAFGVRSAMAMARARQLCPQAVILPGHFSRYQAVSAQVHEVFASVTDVFEPIGLDEAFLDVSPARRRLGDAQEIAVHLRHQVAERTGLTCSVGIGATKMVAKLASRAAKPTATRSGVVAGPGVVVVPIGEELAFLHPMAIRALWGIGPATAAKLERVGITTVGELAALDAAVLERLCGRALGQQLLAMANGHDGRAVESHRPMKSISQEQTFAVDLVHHDQARPILADQAERVAVSLRTKGVQARTISIKVRSASFTTLTRSHTVEVPIDTAPAILAVAEHLLDAVSFDGGVRLLGVAASGFDGRDGGSQLSLFEAPGAEPAAALQASWSTVSGAVDEVRARFGAAALTTGQRLAAGASKDVDRPREERWGPLEPEVS